MNAKNHIKIDSDRITITLRREQPHNAPGKMAVRNEHDTDKVARFLTEIKQSTPSTPMQASDISYFHLDTCWVVIDALSRRI